jgi:thioredoxin reductase/predicted ATP-grasp superfamily ATP-dependent carboligase
MGESWSGSAKVIITDAETRGVVATCRGLRAAGYEVSAVGPELGAAAHWSRACSERLTLPHPLEDDAGFLRDLRAAVVARRYDVLVAGSDASLIAISRGRDALEPHVAICMPPDDVVTCALDKRCLAAAAETCGLRPPETAVCGSAAEARAAARAFGFPVLIKPAHSVLTLEGVRRRVGTALAHDEGELAAVVPDYGIPVLVQRRVAGPVVSFAGVRAGGALTGVAVSVYRRTWLPDSGNVSFSCSIPPPDGLAAKVERLLELIGWEGIFELELIHVDGRRFAAIDLNPRPYGSLALAVRAGANLPALWCRWVLEGRRLPAGARAGVHYRLEDADLRHMLWQFQRGRLLAGAAVMRPHRQVAHPYFELRDPAPMIGRALEMGRVAASRRSTVPKETDEHRRGSSILASRNTRAARGSRSVAVIGAGPYGLAAAAHLHALGVRSRVFGEPLQYWRRQMPAGMILRSRRRSSSIADPRRELTIERYEEATGRTLTSPSLLLEEFVEYGRWYQSRVAPDVDGRLVTRIQRAGRHGFALSLEDGDEVISDRVIVAAGLGPFQRRPEPLAGLPPNVVSHASDHADLSRFADQVVIVVGAGQSALESAALLSESGAHVELIARAKKVRWLAGDDLSPQRRRFSWRPPPTDVGGRVTGWIAALPDVFRAMPRPLHPTISHRCIRPAGAAPLRPRLATVRMTMGRAVVAAERSDGTVRLTLDDRSERVGDHVLLCTGYEIDVRRYPFIGGDLARALHVVDGYPTLSRGMESSVPGLHFLGAVAARSFGPIQRFVVGTWFAAPTVALAAAGRWNRPLRRSF